MPKYLKMEPIATGRGIVNRDLAVKKGTLMKRFIFYAFIFFVLGLGGCTAFDVVMILNKSRQKFVDCHVEIEAERAEEIPKVFTRIHAHFIVSGKNLDKGKVEKAVNLSAEKYCSASKMFESTAQMSHDFEIVETD